jgi:hypothetical protein
MKRLTEKKKGVVGIKDCLTECKHPLNGCDCRNVRSALRRLAAYEDTDLSPEDCAEYKKFEDEIIKSGKTFRRIIELIQADREGDLK